KYLAAPAFIHFANKSDVQYPFFLVYLSDVMEEDVMGMELCLVFLEDGSYSRGPVDIPVGEVDDSTYYHSPISKFEQILALGFGYCKDIELVHQSHTFWEEYIGATRQGIEFLSDILHITHLGKHLVLSTFLGLVPGEGCHKGLRIVHTIEFDNGGAEIQIFRVAVYEEEWVSPTNIGDPSDLEFDLKPFSQRKQMAMEGSCGTPYVYLCTGTLKKRSLPESSIYFGEEVLDMQDVAVLWLPGGVTGYIEVNKDGVLCIGVGWYSDEGINLVMERDYGIDGKLKEVRWKSEVKRRWSEPLPV
ncbi:hypothetical protein RJ641_017088, partial [Dillenia turbinata]